MEMNLSKSMIMELKHTKKQRMMAQSKYMRIPMVRKIKYLGSIINNSMDFKEEYEVR